MAEKIGFVGVGRMGSNMARRLKECGYEIGAVYDVNAVAAQVSFVEIKTDKGHDAFLLEEPEMFATVRGFLNHAAQDLR